MDKKRIYHIIEWAVALAACGYLVWRLATYEDYAALWATLRGMGKAHVCALVVCVALMPVNMAIEAWRWYSLMNYQLPSTNYQFVSWHDAHLQVYYSKLAGVITPWRLGEYPARAVLMKAGKPNPDPSQRGRVNTDVWAKVLSMGAVGSATMTAAIIASGLLAMMVDGVGCRVYGVQCTVYGVGCMVILMLLGVALWFAPRLLWRWAVVTHRLVAISLGQSMLRLVCWCVQLGLVIFALSSFRYDILTLLRLSFVYYLFVTITPNVPVAEAGVRGAWAMVVFGTMNAALAGVLLWGINTLLPCLIWLFLRKNNK